MGGILFVRMQRNLNFYGHHRDEFYLPFSWQLDKKQHFGEETGGVCEPAQKVINTHSSSAQEADRASAEAFFFCLKVKGPAARPTVHLLNAIHGNTRKNGEPGPKRIYIFSAAPKCFFVLYFNLDK